VIPTVEYKQQRVRYLPEQVAWSPLQPVAHTVTNYQQTVLLRVERSLSQFLRPSYNLSVGDAPLRQPMRCHLQSRSCVELSFLSLSLTSPSSLCCALPARGFSRSAAVCYPPQSCRAVLGDRGLLRRVNFVRGPWLLRAEWDAFQTATEC
jgi:hypothetical protein